MSTLRDQIEAYKAKRREEIVKEIAEAELADELKAATGAVEPAGTPATTTVVTQPRNKRMVLAPTYARLALNRKPPVGAIRENTQQWEVYQSIRAILGAGHMPREELQVKLTAQYAGTNQSISNFSSTISILVRRSLLVVVEPRGEANAA